MYLTLCICLIWFNLEIIYFPYLKEFDQIIFSTTAAMGFFFSFSFFWSLPVWQIWTMKSHAALAPCSHQCTDQISILKSKSKFKAKIWSFTESLFIWFISKDTDIPPKWTWENDTTGENKLIWFHQSLCNICVFWSEEIVTEKKGGEMFIANCFG